MARTSPSEGSKRGARPGSPRARLFVALELPDGFRRRLGSWRDAAIANREDVRPVAVDSLHVTLVFLGWQPEKQIPAIAQTVAGACETAGAAALRAGEVSAVPPRRPRLFALDLVDADGASLALQAALSSALAAGRFYRPEKRPFWPHVTLARVKRGRRADPLELREPPPPDEFEASVVTLYRSTLRPQGALYEPLERVNLG